MIQMIENPKLYMENIIQAKYKCNRCGHVVIIPKFKDKNLCDYCGYYVYRTPEIEFKERLKESMRKNK